MIKYYEKLLQNYFKVENIFQLKSHKGGPDKSRSSWIAAIFEKNLPSEMRIGDGSKIGTGSISNRPLSPDSAYKIFVRAFVTTTVSGRNTGFVIFKHSICHYWKIITSKITS